MAIQSLGYIGVNATQLDSWKGFACDVMGLEDVSDALGDDSTHYYKMDYHPYRVFVQAADTDNLALCGWETNNQAGLDEVASALTAAISIVKICSSQKLMKSMPMKREQMLLSL